ncbi:MAG: DUF4595 domain-containing protein [Bacteroides sp.]
MRRLALWAAASVLFVACQENEVMERDRHPINDLVFTTSWEETSGQGSTRTYINEKNQLRWNADDRISVFAATTENRPYHFNGETGDNSGTFSPVGNAAGTGSSLKKNYAVYPYREENAIAQDGSMTVVLPATQHYVENSFGLEANTMTAVTRDAYDTFLPFKNVGGYLKLLLYDKDRTIKSITLKGNNGEKLAGKATVKLDAEGLPSVTMTDEATDAITLDCGEGVTIGKTAETATPFWIVLPPTTFEKGFTITVEDVKSKIIALHTAKPLTVVRNSIKPMEDRLVKSIDPRNVFVNGVPKRVGAYTIIVDEETGLVSKIVRKKNDPNDKEETSFIYPTDMDAEPLTVTMVENSSWFDSTGWNQETRTMTLTLDENLFVKEAVDDDGESWVFTYSDEGYMTQFVCTYDGESVTGTYNYENGDITSSSEKSDWGDNYYNTIIPSNIENKGCIMLHSTNFRVDIEQYIYAYYAGLLGKATKHLPASVSGEDNWTFNWTLNDQGFPILLTEPYDNFDSIPIEW